MDLFWIKLILSFITGGVYIAFTIFLSEKFGSKLGGIILGLPSTTLISLIFIAWSQDMSAVVGALPIIPAAISLASLFTVVFMMFFKHGIKTAFLVALLIWAICGLSFIFLEITFFHSIILAAIIFAAAILYLQKFPHTKLKKISTSFPEFFYRSFFAGTVIVISVLMSKFMGPVWGGLFAVFPAAFSSSLFLLSNKYGFNFTSSVARSMPFGSIGTAVFALSLYFLILSLEFVPAIIISYVISLLYAIIIYKFYLK
ncbi:MAG: DUF3147 family protein [Candidatus Micrarchaeota archaeon]